MPRTRPLVTTVLLFLAALLGANVALLVGSRGAEPERDARVRAYGTIGAQGATATAAASLARPARRSARVVGAQDALGTVAAVTVDAGAGGTAAAGVATATIRAEGLSLLGGRVTVDAVEGRVWVRADAAAADARVTSFAVEGVRVDGAPVTVASGSVVAVPGAGEVGFGEVGTDGPGTVRLTLVRVFSTASSPGPAATLAIGHADARAVPGPGQRTARDAVPAPRPLADPEAPTMPAPLRPPPPIPETPDIVTAPPAARPGAAPVVPYSPVEPADPAAPAGRLLPGTPDGGAATAGGPVFPVLGETSYTDDYGAARAVTGTHHGNDLFAAVGTPVVAVADGTLSRVGWNTLGGNRLWLTDATGTAYYYAHLSAYAPVAAEGARVRAGEVIAYVGNTGQAATTPSHLHFEIHPGGGEAASVDPYPLLRAWQAGARAGAAPVGGAAMPDAAAGAVVVGIVPERDEGPSGGGGLAVSAR